MTAAAPARHGPLLRSQPWARAVTALILTLFATIGVFVSILDAAAIRAAGDLAPRLAGAATVVVWAHGLESADAAQARAAEIVASVPGAGAVTLLDPALSDSLIARLAGVPASASSGARLLAIQAHGDGQGLAGRLEQGLSAQGLPARAADHSWKDSPAARTAALIAAVGVLVPLVAVVAFAVVGSIEARREMSRARSAIELMRLGGASQGYVAGLVRSRVAGLALTCALWAAALAVIAAALSSRAGWTGPLGDLTRADLVSPWPLLVLLAWPAAALGGWLGARGRLRSAP
jgi:cell division transport system permease protein